MLSGQSAEILARVFIALIIQMFFVAMLGREDICDVAILAYCIRELTLRSAVVERVSGRGNTFTRSS